MRRSYCIALAGLLALSADAAIGQAPLATRAVRLHATIGNAPTVAEAHFGQIGDVIGGPGGRVYILDVADCRLVAFDHTGRFLRTLARRGGGPGELQCPGSEVGMEGEEIVVTNVLTRMVTAFGSDGTFRGSRRASVDSTGSAVSRVLSLRSGNVLFVSTNPAAHPTMQAYDPFTTIAAARAVAGARDTIARFRSHLAYVTSGRDATMGGPMASGFGPGGTWALTGDSLLALANGYTGTVFWHLATPRGLALIRTDSLRMRGSPVSPADLRDLEARIRRMDGRGLFGTSPVRILDVPNQRSVAQRALFANDQALWVGTPQRPDGVDWTVFPTAGPPFRVRLPGEFWLSSVRDGLLYGRATLPDGTPVVRIYQLLH